MQIRILHKQGKSLRAIACEVGYRGNTVRKYLAGDSAPAFKGRAPRMTKLAPFERAVCGRGRHGLHRTGSRLPYYRGRSGKWVLPAVNGRNPQFCCHITAATNARPCGVAWRPCLATRCKRIGSSSGGARDSTCLSLSPPLDTAGPAMSSSSRTCGWTHY